MIEVIARRFLRWIEELICSSLFTAADVAVKTQQDSNSEQKDRSYN